MNRTFTSILAGAAAMLVAVHGAQALTYTQTVTFGPAPTDYNGAGLGAQSILLFDTAGGTLNSITFSSTYGFNSNMTITNTAQGSSSGTANTKSGSQFSASTSAITSVLNSMVNTAGTFSSGGNTLTPVAFKLTGSDVNYNLASGASTTGASNASTQTHGPTVDTTGSDLSAFSASGGGSANILFTTLTGTLLDNNGGNTSAQQNTTATGSLTITYTYTAAPPPPPTGVPEPASIALLGAGLLGLGLIRRKA